MDFKMPLLSLENICVAKCAVLVSLYPEVKREILCVHGSEYDRNKSRLLSFRKQLWNKIIKKRAKEMLTLWGLPRDLQKKVTNILPAVALRMLIWADYHSGVFLIARDFLISSLRYSHFNARGVIDKEKAAGDLMKDATLGIKQKYRLACVYCLTGYIVPLLKKILEDDENVIHLDDENVVFKRDGCWLEVPGIVKFWTFGQIRGVEEYTPRSRLRLVKESIRSGSEAAVKYAWGMGGWHSPQYTILNAATEVLVNINVAGSALRVFLNHRTDASLMWGVPDEYFIEMLCFFLSHMTDLQQQHILSNRATDFNSITGALSPRMPDSVLQLFLDWPFQDYFMKVVAVMWNSMSRKTYAALLLTICDKILRVKTEDVLSGEEKSYDYKSLLKDFWCKSPDMYKRFIFTNSTVTYSSSETVTTTGIGLLIRLLSSKKFTHEDAEIVRLILGSATDAERTKLMDANCWRSTCVRLMSEEKFEVFDRLLLVCFQTKEKSNYFKKNLHLAGEIERICVNFDEFNIMAAVQSLISRISLSERELKCLKKEIIYSTAARDQCIGILTSGRHDIFEGFVKWFLSSEREAMTFKKELVRNAPHLSEEDLFELENRFRSNHPSERVIKQLKKSVADIFGRTICEELISGTALSVYEEADSTLRARSEFRGGQWQKVDFFLTWCLSCRREILEFKRNLFKKSGVRIHSKLVKAEQWKEAKTFFVWLKLSSAQIKKLKISTLSYESNDWKMCRSLMYSEHEDEVSKLEKIDRVLRWNLTDVKAVLKFQNFLFKCTCGKVDETCKQKLNSLFEKYLNDLEGGTWDVTGADIEERFFRYVDDERGVKRKSVAFSLPKKLCLLPSEEEKKEKERNRRRSQRLLNKAKK